MLHGVGDVLVRFPDGGVRVGVAGAGGHGEVGEGGEQGDEGREDVEEALLLVEISRRPLTREGDLPPGCGTRGR